MDTSHGPPPNDQRHEGDVAPFVSKDSPTAEEAQSVEPARDPNAQRDSSDRNIGMAREGSDFTARLPAVGPFPLVSKDSPTAEEARSGELARDPNSQRDSPDQRIAMAREGSDVTARYREWTRSSLGLPVEPCLVVPKELLTAEEVRSCEPARDPNATRDSSNQSIGMGRQGSEPSPGLRAMEASIHMSARPSGLNDQSASDRPSIGRGTYRSVARFFISVLIAAFIGVAVSSA